MGDTSSRVMDQEVDPCLGWKPHPWSSANGSFTITGWPRTRWSTSAHGTAAAGRAATRGSRASRRPVDRGYRSTAGPRRFARTGSPKTSPPGGSIRAGARPAPRLPAAPTRGHPCGPGLPRDHVAQGRPYPRPGWAPHPAHFHPTRPRFRARPAQAGCVPSPPNEKLSSARRGFQSNATGVVGRRHEAFVRRWLPNFTRGSPCGARKNPWVGMRVESGPYHRESVQPSTTPRMHRVSHPLSIAQLVRSPLLRCRRYHIGESQELLVQPSRPVISCGVTWPGSHSMPRSRPRGGPREPIPDA